jgi:hypothetical protein
VVRRKIRPHNQTQHRQTQNHRPSRPPSVPDMKCHEFENRLHALLDDRRSPAGDSALAAHAAACPTCGQLLRGQQVLLSGLRAGLPPLADDFAYRTLDRYRADTSDAPLDAVVLPGPGRSLLARRAWQVAGWLLVSAAALLLGFSIFLASRPADNANNAVVTKDRKVKKSEASAPPLLAEDQIGGSARSHPRRDAVARRRSFISRPAGGYGMAIADMATSLPGAVERIEEVERKYAPGIRPIRVSFAVLWEALWRSLPGLDSSESGERGASLGLMDAGRLV